MSDKGRANLVEDALDPRLDPVRCDLDHWFESAGRRYASQRHGHEPGLPVPRHMLEPGPLRDAILDEFSFRACTEESAVRGISYLVHCAPDLDSMDFYATQLLDEARHAYVFRWHLIELGLPRARIAGEIERLVGDRRRAILEPLEAFALPYETGGDFIALVVILAVIAEGALAPAAELSARKWRVLDPPAAQVAHGANLDEIRHLAVGSSIVRAHVEASPAAERERLVDLIRSGMEIWKKLPIPDVLVRREQLFQAGLEQHRELAGDSELVEGRPLAETSVEERLALQLRWSTQMRERRLAFMGLDGVAP